MARPIFKAPVLTAWTWAGPYIGANIGYSAGKSKTDAVFSDFTTGAPLFATGSTDNLNGAIGGIQGGYNWQWGNWVGGIEADVQISGQGATPSYLCPGAVCNPGIVDFDAPVTASFDQGHKLEFVRHPARTFRHHHHARCHGLCHRRPGGRLDQEHACACRRRLRRRRQCRCGQQRCERAD